MAFVNEFVPDEDVKKYELEKIWDSFRPFHKGGYKSPSFRFTWTIDRERNAFFMPILTGREEYSNQSTCALWLNGVQVVVVLESGKESTSNIREGTGRVVWNLVRLHKPSNVNLDEARIIELLKEALVTYGYRGVWRSLPHYTVDFVF